MEKSHWHTNTHTWTVLNVCMPVCSDWCQVTKTYFSSVSSVFKSVFSSAGSWSLAVCSLNRVDLAANLARLLSLSLGGDTCVWGVWVYVCVCVCVRRLFIAHSVEAFFMQIARASVIKKRHFQRFVQWCNNNLVHSSDLQTLSWLLCGLLSLDVKHYIFLSRLSKNDIQLHLMYVAY